MVMQGTDTRIQFASFEIRHETIEETWERYERKNRGEFFCPFEREVNGNKSCAVNNSNCTCKNPRECNNYRDYLATLG